ncbi:MAG TPA: DUF6220 domain-containing protein [Gaiellaceae bacterium]|jgi:hypothetical protein
MSRNVRIAYRYVVSIFLVGVVVQFFLAGLGVFRAQRQSDAGTAVTDKLFGSDFDPHVALGNTLLIVGVVAFLCAAGAKLGRRWVSTALALPVLVALQSVFANAGPAPFRALHPVNAILILGVAVHLTIRAWAEQREAPANGAAVVSGAG